MTHSSLSLIYRKIVAVLQERASDRKLLVVLQKFLYPLQTEDY